MLEPVGQTESDRPLAKEVVEGLRGYAYIEPLSHSRVFFALTVAAVLAGVACALPYGIQAGIGAAIGVSVLSLVLYSFVVGPAVMLAWFIGEVRLSLTGPTVRPTLVAVGPSDGAATPVKFNGQPKIAIAIESFEPNIFANRDWLERWPAESGASIMAVQTTAEAGTHGMSFIAEPRRFVLIDAPTAEGTASGISARDAVERLQNLGLQIVPFDEALVRVTGCHNWFCRHFRASRVTLTAPLQEWFTKLDAAPHYTAIACVNGNAKAISVSFDVFVYYKSGESVIGLLSGLTELKDYKLKFSAAITNVPNRKQSKFKRIEPRRLIRR